jgi:hypothetical protein
MPLPILAIVVSAALLLAGTAQAMEIRQFDKMADQDQAEYIGDLIVGAEKVLRDAGKPELAAQVEHLFTTRLDNDRDTIGMVEFERSLAIARLDDLKDHEKKPTEPWLEVEDVMSFILHKNNIELPDSFFDVNENFRPKLPPKK